MDIQEIRRRLQAIEPDESIYVGMTEADVPVLQRFLAEADTPLAARAVFALSRIGGEAALRGLVQAAADARSPVRVAVATAVAQRPLTLPDAALAALLTDREAGVRKYALSAVKKDNGPTVKAALTRLVEARDEMPMLKTKAQEALRRVP